MRKALVFTLLAACAVPTEAAGAEATRDRIVRYFTGWFSYCPETRVTATPVPDLALPGFEAYRVERACSLKNRNDMTITLYDPAKNEIFVGEVLHDDTRKGRPFSEAQDLPTLRAVLADAFGVPVTIQVGPASTSKGPLKPIKASLKLAEGAIASLPGFVAEDGATLLVGEFRPLDVAPDALRRRILSESVGIRPRKGAYYVTAFIDFQCEKCRQRSPQISDFAWTHGGGALEVRFLPMVKVHDWAFAAAETAAALGNVSAPLYARYEETVFPQANAMTPAAVRQAGVDVAEAAGVGPAFREELSSGRARQRVVRDVELAMRLGLNGTPVFFYEGAYLSSDTGLAEGYIESRLRGTGAAPARYRLERPLMSARRLRRDGRSVPGLLRLFRVFLVFAALLVCALAGACGRRPEQVGAVPDKTPAALPPPSGSAVESADVPTRTPRPPGGRTPVIWLGLDGLDWELLDRLVSEGRMPNWKRLTTEGYTASLKSFMPVLSPVVWTSVATGATPDVHRVLDFQEVEAATGQKTPISGESRAVPAVWNVASAEGLKVGVVGWWATHPAEEVSGFFVTDHASPILFRGLPRAGVAYPVSLTPGVEQIIARDGRIADAELAAYLDVPPAEIARERAAGQGLENPVVSLASILGATRVQQRIARELYDRNLPDLMVLYLEGTDGIGHVFASYVPPKMDCVSAEDFARYKRAVDEYYALIDKLLGQWMRRAEEDGATLVINSDHGFKWGADRTCERSSLNPATAAFWHRIDGVFAAWGPRVRKGLPRGNASVYDVAPTVSALLGLPVDRSLKGSVIRNAFTELSVPPKKDLFGKLVVRRVQAEAMSEKDADEYAENLRNLGYLSGSEPTKFAPTGGARPGLTDGGWNNLGVYERENNNFAAAETAFRKALELRPGYASPQYNMAVLYRTRGQDGPAVEWLFRSLAAGHADPEGTVLRWFGEYDEKGKKGPAREVLERGARAYPADERIGRELGLVRFQAKDCEGALEVVRAFEATSRDADTINAIALFQTCLGRPDEALALFEKSLRIKPGQPGVIQSLNLLKQARQPGS